MQRGKFELQQQKLRLRSPASKHSGKKRRFTYLLTPIEMW